MHPQLDDSLKPALVGLTQALVFRRARRVCFGYVKGSAMRRLNRSWREKMRLVRRLSPQALGVPDIFVPPSSAREEGGGSKRRSYQETSRALSEMTLCLTPQVGPSAVSVLSRHLRSSPSFLPTIGDPFLPSIPSLLQEMSDCLLTAVKALHVEARLASGSDSFVDADTLFPILLYALTQADLPDAFACLYCLQAFAAADYVGEKGRCLVLSRWGGVGWSGPCPPVDR